MSTTLAPLRASASAPVPPAPATASTTRERLSPGDRSVLGVLGLCFVALTALTWRKWGVPEIDAGAELTTADLIKHGAVAYKDVRYYYGPLGLYSLALSFKLFGSSFTTAFAFGLAQTAAIVAAFYVLARQWLVPLVAGLASAVLLAIGFSGTAFNFILPHTDSATFGILCLLLMLLALTRERISLAGLAAGLVALTRPEFLAVAAGAGVAYVVGVWRVSGRGGAWRAAWRMALPAIAMPAVVYALFSAQAGASRLFTENLWPVKFLSSGAKTEQSWMPFTLGSLFGLIARGAIYCGLLAAVVASAVGWSTSTRAPGELRQAPIGPVAAGRGDRDDRLARRTAARRRDPDRPALGDRARGAPPGARHELAAGARPGRWRLGVGAPGARGELSPGTLLAGRPGFDRGGGGTRPARLQRFHDRGLIRPLLRRSPGPAAGDPARTR